MFKVPLPMLSWLKTYNKQIFACDSIAAIIVTVLLIPQSLAYALLAGVPAEMGLYASILPLIFYSIFGTSRTLSVGPVAVVSLMTATAIGEVAATGGDYVSAAIVLAFLSGIMLIIMGLLGFGIVANFLSHPVLTGFITASALIIALSQVKHIFGIDVKGANAWELVDSFCQLSDEISWVSFYFGSGALVLLLLARRYLKSCLRAAGFTTEVTSILSKASPIMVILLAGWWAYSFGLESKGLALVGDIPQGLPSIRLPNFSIELWLDMMIPAFLISIIGYIESISVGKTLAAKRRQRIDSNQEFFGLGAANIASAVSSGIPVTGGFSRSIVNFESGAVTPIASILTAIGVAVVALFLTPYLYFLPKAVLASTIILAVTTLINVSVILKAWRYSKSDFWGLVITFISTLLVGVEIGILSGVLVSIALHLIRSSRPHVAIVGGVPGTEHFRNVLRHSVETTPFIVSLRIDESLYFINASYLESVIHELLSEDRNIQHIVLMCSAVNDIDMSGLEVLEALDERLSEVNITLNLSEVKGPVMDFLEKTEFLQKLNGRVFLTQYQAITELSNFTQ